MTGARGTWFEPVAYGSVSVLLWLVPVFDRLHAESAAVVAFTAFFVAGAVVVRRTRDPRAGIHSLRTLMRMAAGRIGWLALPAALLTVS
ncbi:MAG: hypothetical protein HKN17_10570, partial [Rhodothermales bacterium]|nr:hypothetical protein [Rhodothermales bacterium]